ncbi:hypothetical protein [Leifsonia sp. Leaf264]|uniref:hypothetical protein n=1 Tax=Leifsonia sp. Leaf264 TaxID=1736314 RepID=UPI0006FF5551|nr:hypothetical protein [Leifsonia sp. Leaf264]KQO98697.1 hypothetical protein ASF30_11585 [Leifsonia sp. Leaf264]
MSRRALAERVGRTTNAIVKAEENERAGAISLKNWMTNLEALGVTVHMRAEMPPAKRLTEEARLSLELHRHIAGKLLTDDGAILGGAGRALTAAKAHSNGSQSREWINEWERLCGGPLPELVAMMISESELAIDMRQVSPFAFALTKAERSALLHRILSGPR